MFCHNTLDFLCKGVFVALLAAEDIVEGFTGSFILAFGEQDGVSALAEVICRSACRCLQRRYGFFLFMPLSGARHFLMLKDQKEPPRDGLP